MSTKTFFAMKIIKDKKIYFDQSVYEVYILNYLKKKSVHLNQILEIVDYFYYNHRLHLVTELLGHSLYKAFIKPRFPITMLSIQTIVKDLVLGLKALKDLGIIHCDLKPENILLKKNESNHVKIVDFGSAIFIIDND